ncbi:MAG: hypothetical protein WCG80_18580 [Spirochaetales bacterium]
MKALVADATALLVLAKLGKLNLLNLVFDQVLVPSQVLAEVRRKPDHEAAVWNQPWLTLTNGTRESRYHELCRVLDPGESEALALAVRESLPLLIDERKGRTVATRLGVAVVGLLGILVALVRSGGLSADEAIALVAKARSQGFRVSESLYQQFVEAVRSVLI